MSRRIPAIPASWTTPAMPDAERRLRATRVGLAAATCFVICFVTGVLSHWVQHPAGWFGWPANPVWFYRVTQGVHVLSGIAAIPLILVKLAVVYPRLFERPVIGSPVRLLERLSIAVLVSACLFQLVTGLLNIAQWYPWRFFFTSTHHAMAYVAIGALMVHIAVKLPVIRRALEPPATEHRPTTRNPGDTRDTPAPSRPPGALDRRTLFVGTAGAVAISVLAFAGQTVPWLRRAAILAPRSGEGPQGVPVNRTAAQAAVEAAARAPGYRLEVRGPQMSIALDHSDLERLPQHTVSLPITCVEGWSADAVWTGVRLRDLVEAVDGSADAAVRMVSLERVGLYATSEVPASHVTDGRTLVALRLHGELLDLDHGYPARLIAPNLPGVMQTKWLARVEVR